MKAKITKTAICGIGNRLRGDDGAGPAVIDRLKKRSLPKSALLLDCGQAPESFAGKILSSRPDTIIIIDAVEMDRPPGSIEEIPAERIKAQLATTHKMPITLFMEYLQRSLPDTEIVFMGIQQKRTGFGDEMSKECKQAVEKAADKSSRIVKKYLNAGLP